MPLEVNFNSSTGGPTDTFNYFSDKAISSDGGGINLTVLLIISVVLILYYVIFASLGVSGGDSETTEKVGKSVIFLEILINHSVKNIVFQYTFYTTPFLGAIITLLILNNFLKNEPIYK